MLHNHWENTFTDRQTDRQHDCVQHDTGSIYIYVRRGACVLNTYTGSGNIKSMSGDDKSITVHYH